MAQALQCPKCGAKHPLDRHTGEASFSCSRCGQLLKVPERFRSTPARPAPTDDATMAEAGGATRVLPTPPRRVTTPPAGAVAERRRPRRIWRLTAWVAAVLLSGLIVFVVGRAVGYLSGQRALDVVISSGLRRYTVLLPLVPVWALVATALVTLFLDGGPALARRRRARARPRSEDERPAGAPPATPASPDAAPSVPDDPVPPARPAAGRRVGGRRAGGHPS